MLCSQRQGAATAPQTPAEKAIDNTAITQQCLPDLACRPTSNSSIFKRATEHGWPARPRKQNNHHGTSEPVDRFATDILDLPATYCKLKLAYSIAANRRRGVRQCPGRNPTSSRYSLGSRAPTAQGLIIARGFLRGAAAFSSSAPPAPTRAPRPVRTFCYRSGSLVTNDRIQRRLPERDYAASVAPGVLSAG